MADRTHKEILATFGHLIDYPKSAPHFDDNEITFPAGLIPSEEQRSIVGNVLNNDMRYVWGAPGTGKTQYVLATSIMAYLRKNGRVAVLAPTNNSLEQVLRGLLKVIRSDDPEGKIVNIDRDVLRIGIATKEFMDEYPSICERKGLKKEIESIEKTLKLLMDVFFEKAAERLKTDFDQLDILISELNGADPEQRRMLMDQIDPYVDEIKLVLGMDENLSELLSEYDEYDIGRKMNGIRSYLYDRDRPALEMRKYVKWGLDDVVEKMKELIKEKEELESQVTSVRAINAKIIA